MHMAPCKYYIHDETHAAITESYSYYDTVNHSLCNGSFELP